MEGKTAMWRRYLRFFGPDPAGDVDAELHFHLQAKVDDLLAQGWSSAAAQQEAERQFGNLTAVRAAGIELAQERQKARERKQWWAATRQDIRYGVRTLRRERGFAFITILILALGIAANTTVFSVVNAVLLRPLPFPDSQRLTWFTAGKNLPPDIVKSAGLGAITFSVPAFEDFARHNQSFEKLTSFNPFYGNSEYTLTGRGEPKPVAAVMVAENFFQTLGVQPAEGRFFSKEECEKGGPHAVLLSYAFWHRQLAAQPAIIGQALTLGKASYTVVGVLPPTFDFGSVFAPGLQMDVFVPAQMQDMRGWGNTLAIVGRLKPGVSVARAQSEADRLFPQLKAANPDWEIDYSSQITSLKEFVSGKLRRSLLVLWSAVGLILLIVCVNLSNLLLARSVARSKEFALRTALGADRGRLFRQLITEGFVLATTGALLGLALSFLATTYLARQTSITLPLLSSVKLDHVGFAWALLLTIGTTLLFGCLPALKLASSNTQDSLKASGQGLSAGRKHETLRTVMVISEVALSCVLLIGAGLLLRSFVAVLNTDLGFQPGGAAVMKIDYNSTPARRGAVLQDLLQRVHSIPGIETEGVADMLPLGGNRSWAFQLRGKTYPPGIPGDIALVRIVTPGYLPAMAMHLVSGRDFNWHDSTNSAPVIIINQAAAHRFWPGQDPLAQTLHVMDGKAETHVVGVLSNVRENSL
jgi:predicted permease